MKLYERLGFARTLYPLSAIYRVLPFYIKNRYKAELIGHIFKIVVDESGFDVRIRLIDKFPFHINTHSRMRRIAGCGTGSIKEYDYHTKQVLKRDKRTIRYKKLLVKLGMSIKENPRKNTKI